MQQDALLTGGTASSTAHAQPPGVHTMQAYQQQKIHAAMEEANTKPGVKAMPAALETSAHGALPGRG